MKRGHYKHTVQYLEDNKESIRNELQTTIRADLARKYNVSTTSTFLILGRKGPPQYPTLNQEQVTELRKIMSDRAICRELNIPLHYFYKHVPRRGEPRGIRKPAPKIVRTEIRFSQMEHKPYWDTTTEVPILGPIKGIKYNH